MATWPAGRRVPVPLSRRDRRPTARGRATITLGACRPSRARPSAISFKVRSHCHWHGGIRSPVPGPVPDLSGGGGDAAAPPSPSPVCRGRGRSPSPIPIGGSAPCESARSTVASESQLVVPAFSLASSVSIIAIRVKFSGQCVSHCSPGTLKTVSTLGAPGVHSANIDRRTFDKTQSATK